MVSTRVELPSIVASQNGTRGAIQDAVISSHAHRHDDGSHAQRQNIVAFYPLVKDMPSQRFLQIFAEPLESTRTSCRDRRHQPSGRVSPIGEPWRAVSPVTKY